MEGSTWETFREDEVEAKVALEALPVFQKCEAIEARAEISFSMGKAPILSLDAPFPCGPGLFIPFPTWCSVVSCCFGPFLWVQPGRILSYPVMRHGK